MTGAALRKAPGGQRTVGPQETLRRVAPLHARLGITRVADITGLDTVGIPVATAVRPNARSLAVSQGKGPDRAAARASAVMEALETWHAEHVDRPVRLARFADWPDGAAVDPARLPAAPGSPYRPDLPLPWIAGTDLRGGAPVWVPFDVVHTDWTLPPGWADGCFPADSNGLASGNHPVEATTHGLCELVERDAAALWAQRDPAAAAACRIDPGTVPDPVVQELLARFHEAGVAVGLWDLTCDTRVPVVLCHAVERVPSPFRPLPAAGGLGCHPDPRTAVVRALTEAAQSRLISIAGARDDLVHGEYRRALDADASAAVRQAVCDPPAPPRPWRGTAAVAAGFATDRLDTDHQLLLDRLAGAGCGRAAAVDLTHPDIGVPVVRVVVEGLEGAGAIYGGGSRPGPRALASGKGAGA
ncbi:MAG TPA: YcaO-like family protein [Pilimelia sp.]|nr:YcaO-like family protein [Pilimelia sp.]